jgi:hypothetical protein
MRIALRSLLLVCGLLLVPPPGWCCYVVDMTEALKTPIEQVPAPTKKCCCCEEPAKPQPEQPKEKPGRPFTYCCPAFDKLKSDGSVRFAPDSAGLHLAIIPLLPVSGTGEPWPSYSDSFTSSAPIHLLHCVWLC